MSLDILKEFFMTSSGKDFYGIYYSKKAHRLKYKLRFSLLKRDPRTGASEPAVRRSSTK